MTDKLNPTDLSLNGSKVFNEKSDRILKNINITKANNNGNELLLNVNINNRLYINAKRCISSFEELIKNSFYNRRNFITKIVNILEYSKNNNQWNIQIEYSIEDNIYYLCESVKGCYPFVKININKSDVQEILSQLFYF